MNDPRIIVTACIAGLLIGCSSSARFVSRPVDRAIAIDGSTEEWDDLIEYPAHIVPELGMAAVNDSSHVYLCLTTDDRGVASKILRAGFSIRFQDPGKKDAIFGVYFPLGIKGGGPEGRKHDPEEWAARVESSLQMLALLGPGKKDTTFIPVDKAESLGIAVRVNAPSMEHCIYEFKAPILKNGNSPYGIVPGKDSSIIVTFESGILPRPEQRPSRGGRGGPPRGAPEGPDGIEGGAPPGGGPGFGGGTAGGGRGFGEGGPGGGHAPHSGSREPIKAIFTLLLSRSPAAKK